MRGELLGCQGKHIADDRTQVLLAELQFDRAGEIDQHLHHAIQTVNLHIDNLKVPYGRCAGPSQLGLEQLEVHNNGVDRVFDLVAHAGGQAANGGHAARKFQFRLDLFGRLQIVQGNERAKALSGFIVVNKVN